MMTGLTRIFVILTSLILFILGACFLFHYQLLERYWLWPYQPWQSDVFLGGALLAAGIAYLTCAITAKLRALFAVCIASIVCTGGSAVYCLSQAAPKVPTLEGMIIEGWGEYFLIFMIINIGFLIAAYKKSPQTQAPLPTSLKWILGTVMGINFWIGVRLIAILNIFAWSLTADTAVLYGWMLLGAAVFIGMILLEPIWENVWPLLSAFFTFDLILIGPLCYLLLHPYLINTDILRPIYFLTVVVVTLFSVIIYSMKCR